MRPRVALIAALLLLGACAHNSPAGAPVSTAQLLGTQWTLTKLGDQQITTPQDARAIHMVLSADNQRISGFSGCNQMMGGYVLNGDTLKFDQLAGTLMACVSGMDIERKFLAMFGQVARWKIEGETLTLLDADGRPLAVFGARPQPAS